MSTKCNERKTESIVMTVKVALYSDLHLEFKNWYPTDIDADIIVLAGDIAISDAGMVWARKHFKNQPIVYVAGNHEFYTKNSYKLEHQLITTANELDINFLNDGRCELLGVEFIGSTLWTDFDLLNNQVMAVYDAKEMSDYKKITVKKPTGQYRKLSPQDTLSTHKNSKVFLEECFKQPHPRRVVVTHHAPSLKSINPVFATHHLTPCYASHLDGLVASSGATYWFHGHTHYPVDYQLGNTRVMTNQRGYLPHEPAKAFNENFIVEI
jgi:predicted phosphodiesterase